MNNPDKRPNILFVMSDDHAANAISAYGSRLAGVCPTPNIDRLAGEGMLLTNCHCTNAICTPSRASILTGRHSHKNGVRTLADTLPVSERTFVEDFQDAGYQTAIFGKWHVHARPRGFDDYAILPGQGLYHDPYIVTPRDEWPTPDPATVRNESSHYPVGRRYPGHVTDVIADLTLAWLENRDRDRPFLLFSHNKAPHDNFEYADRYEHLFDGIEIPEPESLFEDKSHRSDGSRDFGTSISDRNLRRNAVKSMSRSDYETGTLELSGLDSVGRTRAAYQKYLKDYLRCVKGIDDSLGRILEFLDKHDLTDDTIVVYTSDQGMFLGEHDYIDKRWIYEEAMRMPFLVRYPREIEAGSTSDSIVTNIDFASTFLDYAGIETTIEVDGHSARAVFAGDPPAEWRDEVYHRYWMHMAHHDVPAHYGLRTKEFKLIFFYGLPLDAAGAESYRTPVGWELYDLRNDPAELRNVYDDAAYAADVTRLKRRLLEVKQEIGDTDDKYPELMEIVERAWEP